MEPTFRFNAVNWLKHTAHMTPAEKGAMIDLLAHEWNDESCSLPADPGSLAYLSGLRDEWQHVASRILPHFDPHPSQEGKLASAYLLNERARVAAFKERQANAGRARAAQPRLSHGSATATATAEPPLTHGSAAVQPRFSPGSAPAQPRLSPGSAPAGKGNGGLEGVQGDQNNPSKDKVLSTGQTSCKSPREEEMYGCTKYEADAIYKAYPRHTAPKPAYKAIRIAAAKFGVEYLLERTRKYAAAVQGGNPKFIPHPATWFNQERFREDESEWKPHVEDIPLHVQMRAVEKEIAAHHDNADSTRHDKSKSTPETRAAFKALKAKRDQLNRQIANA